MWVILEVAQEGYREGGLPRREVRRLRRCLLSPEAAVQEETIEGLLSAEAVSKRKIKKVCGNRNLFYTQKKTKVGAQGAGLDRCASKVVRCPISIRITRVFTQPRPQADIVNVQIDSGAGSSKPKLFGVLVGDSQLLQ